MFGWLIIEGRQCNEQFAREDNGGVYTGMERRGSIY